MRGLKRFLCVGALVLCPTVANAQSGAAAGQSGEADNATLAQQRYQRGISLYQGNQFGPALTEFRAAMAIFGSPNSRLYVARCLRGLGRLADAVAEYDLTAREASDRAATEQRYVATREAAANEMRALMPQVGRITLRMDPVVPDARVTVGGREIPPDGIGLAIPVMPGRVHVSVVAPGYSAVERDVEIAAQRERAVDIPLRRPGTELTPLGTPEPTPPAVTESAAGPLRPVAYGALGLGVVGVGTFAIFGTLAGQVYSGLNERCGGRRCPANESDNVALGRSYQTLANVGLAIGVVGIVAGVVLYVVSRNAPPPRVQVGSNGTLLTLTASF